MLTVAPKDEDNTLPGTEDISVSRVRIRRRYVSPMRMRIGGAQYQVFEMKPSLVPV